jgi:hypothetical protein
MMITQQQFNKLTKEGQDEYLFFWSSLYDAQSQKQAIEFTEKTMAMYKSQLTGLARTKVEADLSSHERYQGILEEIEVYERKLKRIVAKQKD